MGGWFVTRSLPAAAAASSPRPRDSPSTPLRGRPGTQGWSHRGSVANSHGQAVHPSSVQGMFQNGRWAQPGRCGPQPACRGGFTTALTTAPFPDPLPATNSCLVPKQVVMKRTETQQQGRECLLARLQLRLVGHQDCPGEGLQVQPGL